LNEGEGFGKSAAGQGFDGLDELFFKGHRVYSYGGLFSILGDRSSEKVFAITQFSREKQADRILFGYGGDRLCKCSTTGRAIARQKKGTWDRPVTCSRKSERLLKIFL
jgi:hypothetical protein